MHSGCALARNCGSIKCRLVGSMLRYAGECSSTGEVRLSVMAGTGLLQSTNKKKQQFFFSFFFKKKLLDKIRKKNL
jgi:hypothetical protein